MISRPPKFSTKVGAGDLPRSCLPPSSPEGSARVWVTVRRVCSSASLASAVRWRLPRSLGHCFLLALLSAGSRVSPWRQKACSRLPVSMRQRRTPRLRHRGRCMFAISDPRITFSSTTHRKCSASTQGAGLNLTKPFNSLGIWRTRIREDARSGASPGAEPNMALQRIGAPWPQTSRWATLGPWLSARVRVPPTLRAPCRSLCGMRLIATVHRTEAVSSGSLNECCRP